MKQLLEVLRTVASRLAAESSSVRAGGGRMSHLPGEGSLLRSTLRCIVG